MMRGTKELAIQSQQLLWIRNKGCFIALCSFCKTFVLQKLQTTFSGIHWLSAVAALVLIAKAVTAGKNLLRICCITKKFRIFSSIILSYFEMNKT